MLGQPSARFQRSGMGQDIGQCSRAPAFKNQNMIPPQMVKPIGMQGHGKPQRVPFPCQSQTGSSGGMYPNLRSPSPLTPIGGLGSPGSQVSCFH